MLIEAIKKSRDVSSMQLICMTKEKKQILPTETERYEAKINKEIKQNIKSLLVGSIKPLRLKNLL